MSDINLRYNNSVKFVLQNGNIASVEMTLSPDGWKEDELEIVRNEEHHGTFTQFTNPLGFTSEYIPFIESAFEASGMQTNLYLLKYNLEEVGGVVKWVNKYIGLADFETWDYEDGMLRLNFNSNNLETIVKARQNDEFELDRKDSIEGVHISDFNNYMKKVYIEGREIITEGISGINKESFSDTSKFIDRFWKRASQRTEIISQGPLRHSAVFLEEWNANTTTDTGEHLFFIDDVGSTPDMYVRVEWDIQYTFKTYIQNKSVFLYLEKYSFDGFNYNLEEKYPMPLRAGDIPNSYTSKGSKEYPTLAFNEGLAIVFEIEDVNSLLFPIVEYVNCSVYNIKVNSKSLYDGTFNDFIFASDAGTRLMEIITGKAKRFYSRFLSRYNANMNRNDFKYSSDGDMGMLGLISGMWLRKFSKGSEKYKSMILSLKDYLDSINAVFNTGIAIQEIEGSQVLRLEKLEYFYRDEVAVELPYPVSNLKRSQDASKYYGRIELGYTEGGRYESVTGLDEPNTSTSRVSPLTKVKNEYVKKSKIRGDEYGKELTRRQPQINYPNKDTQGDEDNWFLDLKRTDGDVFNEKYWDDRLQKLPENILSPKTFKSMIFTPMRMLIRHGWVIRTGMEHYNNLVKKIKYISSTGNSKLSMLFKGESKEFSENQDIKVSYLDKSKFLPEIITFNHAVDDDLMKKLLGSTIADVEGYEESVPNTYFKISFINEKGLRETGYLLEMKPNNSGTFKLIKANENKLI